MDDKEIQLLKERIEELEKYSYINDVRTFAVTSDGYVREVG